MHDIRHFLERGLRGLHPAKRSSWNSAHRMKSGNPVIRDLNSTSRREVFSCGTDWPVCSPCRYLSSTNLAVLVNLARRTMNVRPRLLILTLGLRWLLFSERLGRNWTRYHAMASVGNPGQRPGPLRSVILRTARQSQEIREEADVGPSVCHLQRLRGGHHAGSLVCRRLSTRNGS